MSCRRADTISIEAFLLQPNAAEFEDFRAHSVECSDCTAFLERFADFEDVLRNELAIEAGETEFHPPVEWLANLIDGGFQNAADQQTTESHLERCAACRSELVAMQTFDVEALQAAAGEPAAASAEAAPATSPSSPGIWDKIKNALTLPGGVGGPVPAFAAGLFVLFLVARLITGGSVGETQTPQLAQEKAQPQPPLEEPNPSRQAPREERLAEEPAPTPTPTSDDTTLPAESAPQPPTLPIALEQPEAAPSPTQLALEEPAPNITRDPIPSSEKAMPDRVAPEQSTQEMLLASLGDLAIPTYAAPTGAEADGFEIFTTMRGTKDLPQLQIMAPATHIGLTRESAPRLWWSLSEASPLPVMIVIDQEDAEEPVLETVLPGPQARGFQSIDLRTMNVSLEPGVNYQWFVSLVLDPNRPSKNLVAGGALRVLPASDPRAQRAAAASALEQGHTAAAQGLWYDAFDRFAELASGNPEVEATVGFRDEMIRQSR